MNKDTIKDTIKENKEAQQVRMENYGREVREYIDKYGNDNCDYLIHKRLMESYYRGAYNALLYIEEMV